MNIKVSESIRVALFAILGVSLFYLIYSSIEGRSDTKNGYKIVAVFADIKQLQEDDDVRLAGVKIGSVVDAYLEEEMAVVELFIKNRYKIPQDSIATIAMSGLLGASYVSIKPGKSEKDIAPSNHIETTTSADFSSVVSQFSRAGKKLNTVLGDLGEEEDEVDEITGAKKKGKGSLLSNLNDFFVNNREKLSNIISNVDVVTSNLKEGKGTIGRLIKEEQAYNDMLATMQDIKEAAGNVSVFFDEAKCVVDNFKEGNGMLAKIMNDKNLGEDLEKIVKNIKEFSDNLNNEKSTLGRLIREDDLYKHAQDVLNKVDRATESINQSGPMTAVGVAAEKLF